VSDATAEEILKVATESMRNSIKAMEHTFALIQLLINKKLITEQEFAEVFSAYQKASTALWKKLDSWKPS
jgi:hypothetical protein